MTRVGLARDLAVHFHGDQKYGPRPYVFHLDQVADIVAPWGEDAVIIAFLHDALEDTTIAVSTIGNIFGALVADCVQAVSDSPGLNRAQRKANTYRSLGAIGGDSRQSLALAVKAADRLANVRQSVKFGNADKVEMYREEHPAFRKAVLRAQLNEELVAEASMLLGVEL